MSFSITIHGPGREARSLLDKQLPLSLGHLPTEEAIRVKLLSDAVAEYVKHGDVVSVTISGHLNQDGTGTCGVSIQITKHPDTAQLPLAVDPLAASQVNASGPALARSTPQPGNPPIGGNT